MIWVDVPGWESRYEVSECGRVRSKDMVVRARGGAQAVRKGRELTRIKKRNGYLCVTLTDGTNRPQVMIHRIVARAFLGECPLGLHVLHTDGDKVNNRHTNLRYGTPAENVADTVRHGRQRKGAQHPMAKLDEDAVRIIRFSGRNAKQLAEMFGVTSAHVYAVRKRRVWPHVE